MLLVIVRKIIWTVILKFQGPLKRGLSTGNFRRNIFPAIKRKTSTIIVKHAGAKTVTLKVTVTEKLQLFIKDDGKGFFRNRKAITG
jgi:signal transduction histidine kinase